MTMPAKKKSYVSRMREFRAIRLEMAPLIFEFPDERRARQFDLDIENSAIGIGDQIGNRVTVTDVDNRWRSTVKKYVKKNKGKLVKESDDSYRPDGASELDEALVLASDDVNPVKKTAQKLAKQSPDRTYYVVMNKETHIGGRQIKKYEVVDSVDMHSYRHDKKVHGYGANVKDVKESVEVDEGKMKELHMHIQDGKTAEQIAKIMKIDVKAIKALMKDFKESVELDEAKVPAITFEFRNSMKAKSFAYDIENSGIGTSDQVGNKVTVTDVDAKWRKAVKQILQKNQGKLVQRSESFALDEKADLKGLSDDAKGLLASALNFAATDGGPYAEVSNLEYFTPEALADAMKFINTNKSRMSKSAMKPYKELLKFFKESVDEAKSVPLVSRGQGTSRVDTHPSPTRRLYQAKDKKEYEKLMDAGTHAMTQKMLGKFGITGDYKKYTVEIEFKDEKARKKFEKGFGIKESFLSQARRFRNERLANSKKSGRVG